jgi:hypothetical protein
MGIKEDEGGVCLLLHRLESVDGKKDLMPLQVFATWVRAVVGEGGRVAASGDGALGRRAGRRPSNVIGEATNKGP